MRIVLAILVLLIGAGATAVIAGSTRWNRDSKAAIAKLTTASVREPATYHASSIGALPPPASRFLRKALGESHPIVRSVVATQEAEFFINGAWRPLRATQSFSTSPPGFVWDARIGMAPLLPASVRDAYVDGHGVMQASMFGLYSLADQVDKPELNAGALQRYLGEAVWFPTALLPSTSVMWTPRDDRSAVATLRDGATMVSMIFEFDDDLVTSIQGDRYKEAGGTYGIQPWLISCDEHAARDGMIIPLRCEVSWITNGRKEPYWRGRITSIAYRYD